jgi:MFS family permease
MFMVGWPLAAAVSGRLYTRLGFKTCEALGASIAVFGTGIFAKIDAHTSLEAVGIACFVTGFGLGLVTSPLMVAAQSSVEWNRRGAVTASNMFFRALGSAFAGAVFGAILVATLHSNLSSTRSHSAPDHVVATAMHEVFIALFVLAMITACGVAALPADRRWRRSVDDSAPAQFSQT